jgi:hypothetical protein
MPKGFCTAAAPCSSQRWVVLRNGRACMQLWQTEPGLCGGEKKRVLLLPHAGFGCVCTAATWPWPFFTQAALIAMVYPLFILVAAKSDPLAAYQRGESIFLFFPTS